ncbi:Icarapin-like, partial [Habropoda laboriosa]
LPGALDRDSDERKDVDTVLLLPSDARDRFIRPMAAFDFPDTSFDDSLESPSWIRWNFFDTWYSSIQATIKKWREDMSRILSRIPDHGIVSLGKIPEGANTTSTTKIIDGHVVTINETTYMDGDDEYGTVIRVRVIDVKPQNETILMTESEADAEITTLPTVTTTATATSKEERTTPLRSVETVEDFDNEIPKNQVDTLTA